MFGLFRKIMKVNKDSGNPASSKVIETTFDGVKQFTTIFYWPHRAGSKAHCLVRLFYRIDEPGATIVLSELKSNKIELDIITSFEELAKAIKERFEVLEIIPRENVEWFIHYGGFSTHEGLSTEELLKVNPNQIHQFKHYNLPETIKIHKENFSEYLHGIELGKMRPVLKELDWELEDWLSDPEWE